VFSITPALTRKLPGPYKKPKNHSPLLSTSSGSSSPPQRSSWPLPTMRSENNWALACDHESRARAQSKTSPPFAV
jgi:hypothetical protein